MPDDRLLSSLALCRKAGALAIGFDASLRALAKGARLCVAAADISPRTLKKFNEQREEKGRMLPLARTQDEIEYTVGRRFALAAVCDDKLAALVERCAVQDEQGGWDI